MGKALALNFSTANKCQECSRIKDKTTQIMDFMGQMKIKSIYVKTLISRHVVVKFYIKSEK
jgi:hypothetical protein